MCLTMFHCVGHWQLQWFTMPYADLLNDLPSLLDYNNVILFKHRFTNYTSMHASHRTLFHSRVLFAHQLPLKYNESWCADDTLECLTHLKKQFC